MKMKKDVENINYLSMYLTINDEFNRFVYKSFIDIIVIIILI